MNFKKVVAKQAQQIQQAVTTAVSEITAAALDGMNGKPARRGRRPGRRPGKRAAAARRAAPVKPARKSKAQVEATKK